MQGQASRIEDWGSPRLMVGGLGDDLIKRYWAWRSEAHINLRETQGKSSPYLSEFSVTDNRHLTAAIPTGTSFGDDPQLVDRVREDSRLRNTPLVVDNREVDENSGTEIGTWGILSDFSQNTPAASFPPVNYKQYKNMLVMDGFIKSIFKKDEENYSGVDCSYSN